jgi:hypothetical protein
MDTRRDSRALPPHPTPPLCEFGLRHYAPPFRTPGVITSSVGPFGCACAPLYLTSHLAHVKQRTLGQEPTGRQSILTSHLVHRFTTKATDSRTHAKQSDGLLDSDTSTVDLQPYVIQLLSLVHLSPDRFRGASIRHATSAQAYA